ncbi:MAG: peptidase A2A [Verrucomicrobia bacterium]|nr:MAG: peptidase A2A [Verrucomicrobiota bacterium]
MKKGTVRRLERVGNLLAMRAAVTGPNGDVLVLKLLVDTGASYTIVPVEAVERIGCDTVHPISTVRIVSANGVIVSPMVKVVRFSRLGRQFRNVSVVAHTLPSGTFVDGLLGIDLLNRLGTVLDLERGTIHSRR